MIKNKTAVSTYFGIKKKKEIFARALYEQNSKGWSWLEVSIEIHVKSAFFILCSFSEIILKKI